MAITFNGNVTIYGNVEMYDNGSMKIVNQQLKINVKDLKDFIQKNLGKSARLNEYLEAADVLEKSNDKTKLSKAIDSVKNMGKEFGKDFLINGLTTASIEIIKTILT